MRAGVTGLEHRPELVVDLRERLGAGLERLILDDPQPRDERARLAVAVACRVGGLGGVGVLGVAHALRI